MSQTGAIDTPERADRFRLPVIILFVLGAGIAGLMLFPVGGDGGFAVDDGIHYGFEAEQGAISISGHHPLFHLLAWGVCDALDRREVVHPGHHAIRVVGAVGLAWLMLQIMLLAGAVRWFAGLACACFLLSCRSILVYSAAGETVVLGAAAAVTVFALAGGAAPSLIAVGAALIVALLIRQDNILICPGLALLLAARTPRGVRLRRIAVFFAIAGAATLAAYFIAWRVYRTAGPDASRSFMQWLTSHTEVQTGGAITLARLAAHADFLGDATFGQTWAWGSSRTWVGGAILLACALAGVLVRGGLPTASFTAAIAATVAIRFVFHTWWEPTPLWHASTAALVVAGAAFGARGGRRLDLPRERAGIALIFVLGLVCLCGHWPSTLLLRESRLTNSVAAALWAAPPGTRVFTHGINATAATYFLGGTAEPANENWDEARRQLTQVAEAGTPALLIVDRFAYSLTPWFIIRPGRNPRPIDALASEPGRKVVRADGLVVGVLFTPTKPL